MTGPADRRWRLVVASANPKKAAEIADILSSSTAAGGVELVPRPSDVAEVVEDADTFVGNARLKAASLASATGLPALGDDSGLAVDALDGAPGVRSARYAGEAATDADNVGRLLAELAGVDARLRTARFVCVVVVRWPDGGELVASGEVEGCITTAATGGSGFGYDPVFVPAGGDGRTFAELDPSEKHAVSHRGRALRALAAQLPPPGSRVP